MELKRKKEEREELILKAEGILQKYVGKEDQYTAAIDNQVADIQHQVKVLDREISALEMQELRKAQALEVERGRPGYVSANHETADHHNRNTLILNDMARIAKSGPGAVGLSGYSKAITSTTGSASLENPSVVDDLIFELQSANELVTAGMQVINIENYRLSPKVTAYPTSVWQNGEGSEITLDSSLTIGSVKWQLSDIAVRIEASNQVLLDSSERAQRLIQESMRRQIQEDIGRAIFAGTGLNGEPTGIENFSGVLTHDHSSNTIQSWEPIITGVKKLLQANVRLSDIAVFFSPTVWAQLASMQSSGDGQALVLPKMLEGVRFMSATNLISEGYDTNTSTRVFMGDFSKLILGVQPGISMVLDQTRASHLSTQFILHMRADIQASHENAFLYIDNVTLT